MTVSAGTDSINSICLQGDVKDEDSMQEDMTNVKTDFTFIQ